jgi:L-aspartate oxidase
MTHYHPDGDLAPRDVVARGIVRESKRTGGPVFLTLAHLDPARVHQRFPTISAICRELGLDLATDRIPVGPAAHYLMGGIDTDEWGRTSVPRLYAAGETACTGVHGANRLASNSLLEGLVFGARAGEAMTGPPMSAPAKADRVERRVSVSARGTAARDTAVGGAPPRGASAPSPDDALEIEEVRALMWRDAGLFRSREGLERVLARLDAAYGTVCDARKGGSLEADGWRRCNLITVARLVARAALRREESRGGHFREDFPARDDQRWRIHVTDTIAGTNGTTGRQGAKPIGHESDKGH